MELNEQIFLSVGSNLGDRESNLQQSFDEIRKSVGSIHAISSFFENQAQGFQSDTLFLNCCLQISTHLSPLELLQAIKVIEKSIGRQPKSSSTYESRPIDIDIILFGDLILNSAILTVPHAKYRERDFVLIPLAEISPNIIDPVTHLSVHQLLNLL